MIKIITGYLNTPVVIPDTNIEDSFDVQGYFIGKLPFDSDAIPRKQIPEQPQPPPPPKSQPQLSLFNKRPPSESALRSMAATTTANTFVMKTRPLPSQNIFVTATTTTTTLSSPFQFRGFNSNSPTR